MSENAINVEGIGKKFIIGHQKPDNLRSSFSENLKSFLGKKDVAKEEFWALQDISFQIGRGDAVAIIGRNGAGKSTLLKILSRITDPTTGRFEINGRVSSLLEVGTGFHAELTGRENIFLNGTILGMTRKEIKSKFDEIVEFSGVEKFLDTPVKHYSSGMKVRLAFSVAAHLEPEILIIDEVLAVGDAEFQKKCLGKMDEVSKNDGRTVLFVSHNLAAVSQLCSKAILLRQGKIVEMDQTEKVIHSYITYNRKLKEKKTLLNLDLRKGDGRFRVESVRMLDQNGNFILTARTGSELIFEVEFDRIIDSDKGRFRIDFAIDTEQDFRVAWFSSDVVNNNICGKFKKISLKLPKLAFGGGAYYLTFYSTWNGSVVDYIHQSFSFDVEEGDFFGTGKIIPKTQTFLYYDYQVECSI